MAENKKSFGLLGTALETTKIYGGSNIVKHFDGVLEGDTLQTLGDYVKGHPAETRGIDMDAKSDENLARYNIIKLTPTRRLDEVNSLTEMYLITDEHGHDIGTYEITENGPVFKLAPKIKERNDKIMGRYLGQEREILEEEYSINSLEALVGKLAQNKSVALASNEQARGDIREGYKKRGMPIMEGAVAGNAEQEAENRAIAQIPQDMRGEALEMARQKGLKVKEVLVVDNPRMLSQNIDNRRNYIAERGGPVILIKTAAGEAMDLTDDVYVIQDGHISQDEANDEVLGSYMKSHEDEGHVTGIEPVDSSQEFLAVQAIYEEAQRLIEIEEEAIAQIQYNMDNIEIDENENPDVIMDQMQREIDLHEANIDTIIENRDSKVKDYLSKNFLERDAQRDIAKDEPPQDEEPEKNRWESANPYNGPNY